MEHHKNLHLYHLHIEYTEKRKCFKGGEVKEIEGVEGEAGEALLFLPDVLLFPFSNNVFI